MTHAAPEPGQSPVPMTLAQAMELAVGLLEQNRLDEAGNILAAVLDADPKSPDGLHFMGLLRCRQGNAEEAIELIRRAVDVAPTYAEAFHNLGGILSAVARREEAEQAFGRAVALEPGVAEMHLSLADLLRRSGRRVEAVPVYLRAILLNPALSQAHYQLGKTYFRLGETVRAANTFRAWLKIDPENAIARHMVAALGNTAIPDRASDCYVRGEFDEFADTFDEVMITLACNIPRLIASAVTAIAPAESQLHILDAGCGTGLVGALLKPWAKHLTGVDLSAGMIEQARRRGGYDELITEELTAYLEKTPDTFDLIVSADTFIYFGSLSAVFRGAGKCLRPGGHFVFSVEHLRDKSNRAGFFLQPNGRYSHQERYIRQCLAEAGLRVIHLTEETLRLELNEPVRGLIVTAIRV